MDSPINVPWWLFAQAPPDRQTHRSDESIHRIEGGVHVREIGATGTWIDYVGPADAEDVEAPKKWPC